MVSNNNLVLELGSFKLGWKVESCGSDRWQLNLELHCLGIVLTWN